MRNKTAIHVDCGGLLAGGLCASHEVPPPATTSGQVIALRWRSRQAVGGARTPLPATAWKTVTWRMLGPRRVFTNSGTITIVANVSVFGTSFNNNGTVIVGTTAYLNAFYGGTITNNNTMSNQNVVTILSNNSSNLVNNGTFNNYKTLDNYATINNTGVINNYCGATIKSAVTGNPVNNIPC
jgi:hypothetical protein